MQNHSWKSPQSSDSGKSKQHSASASQAQACEPTFPARRGTNRVCVKLRMSGPAGIETPLLVANNRDNRIGICRQKARCQLPMHQHRQEPSSNQAGVDRIFLQRRTTALKSCTVTIPRIFEATVSANASAVFAPASYEVAAHLVSDESFLTQPPFLRNFSMLST